MVKLEKSYSETVKKRKAQKLTKNIFMKILEFRKEIYAKKKLQQISLKQEQIKS